MQNNILYSINNIKILHTCKYLFLSVIHAAPSIIAIDNHVKNNKNA